MVSEVGSMIYLEAQYQPKRYNDQEFDLKISKIILLNDLKDEKASAINIEMKLDEITEPVINMLKDVFVKHPGEYAANIAVRDHKEKIELNFFSRDYRTSISSEMIEELELIPSIKYSLV